MQLLADAWTGPIRSTQTFWHFHLALSTWLQAHCFKIIARIWEAAILPPIVREIEKGSFAKQELLCLVTSTRAGMRAVAYLYVNLGWMLCTVLMKYGWTSSQYFTPGHAFGNDSTNIADTIVTTRRGSKL